MAPKTALKVAVLGPAGQCGSCVVDELLARGHTVVGISRNPPKTWETSDSDAKNKYTASPVNIRDTKALASAFSGGFDAIVCAYSAPLKDLSALYEEGVEGHTLIKSALLNSEHEGPIIIIGGAGSLHSSKGHQLCQEPDFAFGWWYSWPDVHLDYMRSRAYDHNQAFLGRFVTGFKWARSNVERPRWYSYLFRPFARLYLRWAKGFLTHRHTTALITLCRVAYVMWEGVRTKQWSFLSPPGLLRDKGVRTGKYEIHVDSGPGGVDAAIEGGIYNEDMAVAIVNEIENKELTFKHWSCTGPIGLRQW
ncbi:hypothetical protein BJ170DRAFT_625221 [Xylariales sp. AK1849]|nr:hypothetical protein BJ170DRAFT_625221 [Xylariales sp. AK1849]